MEKLQPTKKQIKKPKAEKPSKSKPTLSVSPSAWMVWEKCALSLQAVKSPLVLERDEYAKEGTRLHGLIAAQLQTNEEGFNPADLGDDAALVRFAVETTKAELNGNIKFAVESPLATTIRGVTFNGIADCIAIDAETVTVIDHKTGWREVEADGNSQLKLYAHITAAYNKKIKRWRGVIINARFNSVSYTGGDIEPDYLSNETKDIIDRTKRKQFLTGNHCAYCQRLSTCSKIRAAIAKWIKPGAIDSITREPEKLAEALRLAKPAEKLFETIKKEAQLFMDLGGVIPGIAVEYTAGTRTWPRDLSVREIAERIGVDDVPKMYDAKVISPAQAANIGADKDAINAIAIRPPRKGFKFI